MKHRLHLQEDGIVYVKIIGDGDAETAHEFVRAAERLLMDHRGRKLDAIIDMSESGTSDYEGIKIYRVLFKNPLIGRLAFVQVSESIKVLVVLAIKLKKPNDVKFFETKAAAQEWLNQYHQNEQ